MQRSWHSPQLQPTPAHDRLAWPARYERQRDLAPLLPMWPHELADRTAAGGARVIGLLRRALRAERKRAIAGDWTYDLARHRALVMALGCEIAMVLADRTGRER